MGLKKIEIEGFKSFAKKTSISISHGINCIVGPNGCGKSNIVDAFLWALGQQSPKTLRASSMQDVIFAGSQKHKAQTMAEVTVVLSNENGLLPIEYQEIAITRKLYRDGESDYLLNKQSVRLKDIVELLAHTGVGKESFAVIGQGKVAEVISQSPQDRRSLFEEVAGISHFLAKRKESERKLELAKANVSRAQDITKEVEAQIKVLEKQAHDAKRYQEQQKKLACLERLLCQSRCSELQELHKSLVTVVSSTEAALSKSQDDEQKLRKSIGDAKEKLKQVQEEHEAIQNRLHALQSSIQSTKKDKSFCEEKSLQLATQRVTVEKEIQNFEASLATLAAQKKKLEEELVVTQAEFAKRLKAKEETSSQWQKGHQEIDGLEQSLKALYAKRFGLQTRLQTIEADLKKSQMALEVANEKIREREVLKESYVTKRRQAEEALKEKKGELAKLVALVDQHKKELESLQALVKDKQSKLDEERKLRSQKQQEAYERNARHKALSQLQSNMEGFTSGAKLLLKEAKKQGSELFGLLEPLADKVSLKEGLFASLYDGALVVRTAKELDRVLAYCEKNKSQDVTIVCLELMGLDTVERLLNHFEEQAKKTKLYQNHYFVDGFGVLHVSPTKKETIFTRTESLKTLAGEIQRVEAQIIELDAKIAKQDEERNSLQQKIQKQDQEMRRIDMQVVSANFQLQAEEKRLTELASESTRHDSEVASLTELTATLKKQSETKESEELKAKEELTAVEKEFLECEAATKRVRSSYTSVAGDKQKYEAAFEEVRKLQEAQMHQIELLAVRIKEQTTRLEQERKLEKTTEREGEQLALKVKELDGELAEVLKVQDEVHSSLVAKKEEIKGTEVAVVEKEKELEKLQSQKEDTIKVTSTKKAELSHVEEELAHYKTALLEPPPEGFDTFEGRPPTDEELTRLRNSVERLRHCNLLAVEEHEQARQRYGLLIAQLEDLQQAECELIQIVADLENESSKAFIKTFQEVRVAFQKHFQTLFQGGEADLVLGEGVEIMAKPPGKQMRSMQLLSGGEKTLTALALLFACFEVRPSPFCILDEVDAPLDESNVERFGKLLSHFCDRTQFLVITHNKKTMQIADTLIGVSMAEKGVSQIISLDFRRREQAKNPVFIHATAN